jgi:hypothetical protein
MSGEEAINIVKFIRICDYWVTGVPRDIAKSKTGENNE